MDPMSRALRTSAAVLAGLALAAALKAPCGCGLERKASRHADDHECCAPPTGLRAAHQSCCDETTRIAEAVPSPPGPAVAVPVAVAVLRFEAPSSLSVLARPAILPAPSPPPAVLRI